MAVVLRLPYGKRTGVPPVDRLNIVGHDKFQEIIDEANKPESIIQLQALELDMNALNKKHQQLSRNHILATQLGIGTNF